MPIWLLANWRLIAKGIGVVIVLTPIIMITLAVRGWYQDSQRLPEVEGRLETLQSQIAAERAEYERLRGISNDYQSELARLRNTGKPPVVRMCRTAPSPVRPSSPTSGPDTASPGGGVVPEGTGPDIGPDLANLANRADMLSAQVRGLISACQP